MTKKKELKWFRMVMFDMFHDKEELDFIMPSEKEARTRWKQEYQNSSWKLNHVVQVEKIDGHKISFS